MRLRSFTGRTTLEAMALVREHLGPDAIIVSTQADPGGGMRVTAAADPGEPARGEPMTDIADLVADTLAEHGVPAALADKIIDATLPHDGVEPETALSGALGALLGFTPLGMDEPLILVGPPGAGKTVTLAKLAARAVLAGRSVRLVTADVARAGAVAQLEAFAKILRAPFIAVDGPRGLAQIARTAEPDSLLLIDSPGINPFAAGDRAELAALIAASGAEPVLVMPAGGDLVDNTELIHVFMDLNCRRAIVTRLDLSRRLGSLVAAVYDARLDLAEAGISPAIADGLTPFSPQFLARLLLPQAAAAEPNASLYRGVQ